MATDPSSELFQFHLFIGQQLRSDGELSPEETLDLWRAEHPREVTDDLVLAAEEAIEDLRNGDRGVPHEQFLAELRQRYGIGT